MTHPKRLALLLGIVLTASFLYSACVVKGRIPRAVERNSLPPVILWAWERNQDLRFLNSEHFGVAFLAQTLVLQGDDVVFRPRRQPLRVSPSTKVIAVTRIESAKTTGERAALSEAQADRLVALIVRTLELDNVCAIQIDFDVTESERPFYRRLLGKVRPSLPNHVPLSITALASFCMGDRWLEDLTVDEVVPMIFRMGTDSKKIKSSLAQGNDFQEPRCRSSYGISLDEPLDIKFDPSRRLYVFNQRAWTAPDTQGFERRALQ